ncbi:MAG: PAS domain S-box protein [Spartobacteria bacterium]|nr:PAS domain S-box protein [Spartobacteria bacterium]
MQAKILAVDDMVENLKVLHVLVEKHLPECTVMLAEGGQAALEAIRDNPPDVILLDAKMPDMDGFEVCRRLKSEPATKNIPVLMMSGIYVAPRDRISGLESGADGYICKPYQVQELIAQIRALLRIKKGEDQLRRHEVELEKELELRSGALKKSEARFRLLFENSPEAIQVESLDGIILDINPAACRLHGMGRDDLIGANVRDLVPDEMRDQVDEEFNRLSSGDIERMEGRESASNGAVKTLDVIGRRIDYGGQPAVLVHIRDITERKRVEDALREVAQGVSESTGFSFFFSLVKHLARALDVPYVVLSERSQQEPGLINTLAVYANGEIADNFNFNSEGSVCEKLIPGQPLHIASHVQEQFPSDTLLTRCCADIDSFIGYCLSDFTSSCIGYLTIMGTRPLKDIRLAESMLQIFASRAASELDRKKAAEELWESEEKYRSLTDDVLDTSSIGTLILDGRYNVVWANQAFEQFFGIRRADIIGCSKDVVLEAQREVVEDPDAVLRSPGDEPQEKTARREYHVLNTPRTPERWLEHWSQPIRSGLYIGGRIEHYADITERKATEAERNRMAMATEQAAEAVIITEVDGTIQYVNPAFEQITGYSREEAIGQNVRLLKSGRHDDAFYHAIWGELAKGGAWSGRLINKKKDGSLYHAEAVISPIRDDKAQVVNYVAVSRDVSHEVELEEQFRQAQKMESVGRLAGGIAHDFNNLLTSILGFSRLILDTVEEGNPIQSDVKEIIRAGERAAKLTRQLLAFGRKQIMQVCPLDINEVVMEMDQLLRRTLGEDVELVTVLGEKLGTIEADIGLLEQVIMNLAVNARDAMPRGGKLTISTMQTTLDEEFCRNRIGIEPGEYVMLAVSDVGCGMAEEVITHAFEPFYTTKEKGKGTGLGLATVYGIVKQCQGAIELESEVDQGTTFKIYLPAVNKKARSLPPKTSVKAPGGKETILVVEDEDTIRNLTVRMLRSLGYNVLEARHGGEALLIGERYDKPIDLVLTDVVMPHIGGLELMKRFREIRNDYKVLYTSGFTEDRIIDHGIGSENVPFLMKPYTRQALSRMIREVLEAT